jgi:hypothetical protein
MGARSVSVEGDGFWSTLTGRKILRGRSAEHDRLRPQIVPSSMAEVADFVQPQNAAIDAVVAVRRYVACALVLLNLVTRIASRRADAMSAPVAFSRDAGSHRKNASHTKNRKRFPIVQI